MCGRVSARFAFFLLLFRRSPLWRFLLLFLGVLIFLLSKQNCAGGKEQNCQRQTIPELRALVSFENAHKHLANSVRRRRISLKKSNYHSDYDVSVGYIDSPVRRIVHKNPLIMFPARVFVQNSHFRVNRSIRQRRIGRRAEAY